MMKAPKGRRHRAAGQFSVSSIEADIVKLKGHVIDRLRDAWAERFGKEAPAIRSRDILLRLFAWRIQVESFGGLDAATDRKLREIARALERDGAYEPKIRRDLSPGVVVTREWKGATHKVTVTTDGFQHLGKRYKSLSDIACTITGTRWSGPRFFGLEQRASRSTRKISS